MEETLENAGAGLPYQHERSEAADQPRVDVGSVEEQLDEQYARMLAAAEAAAALQPVQTGTGNLMDPGSFGPFNVINNSHINIFGNAALPTEQPGSQVCSDSLAFHMHDWQLERPQSLTLWYPQANSTLETHQQLRNGIHSAASTHSLGPEHPIPHLDSSPFASLATTSKSADEAAESNAADPANHLSPQESVNQPLPHGMGRRGQESARRHAQGLCIWCKRPNPELAKKGCPECLVLRAASTAKYRRGLAERRQAEEEQMMQAMGSKDNEEAEEKAEENGRKD